MSETAVPPWVKTHTESWRDKLGLTSWRVNISAEDAPDGDDGCLGASWLFPQILVVQITLRSDVSAEPEKEWQKTIIHELVHARLAEITEFVSGDLIPELSPQAGRMARSYFRRVVEPTVESLTHTLWALEHGRPPDR